MHHVYVFHDLCCRFVLMFSCVFDGADHEMQIMQIMWSFILMMFLIHDIYICIIII